MPETKTYTGGCHCGRVRFGATGDFTEVFECNCSICLKRGALWAFVKAQQFKLVQGEDALADYQFGKKRIHHLFCPSCGVGSFSRGLRRTARRRSRSMCAASTISTWHRCRGSRSTARAFSRPIG